MEEIMIIEDDADHEIEYGEYAKEYDDPAKNKLYHSCLIDKG